MFFDLYYILLTRVLFFLGIEQCTINLSYLINSLLIKFRLDCFHFMLLFIADELEVICYIVNVF